MLTPAGIMTVVHSSPGSTKFHVPAGMKTSPIPPKATILSIASCIALAEPLTDRTAGEVLLLAILLNSLQLLLSSLAFIPK